MQSLISKKYEHLISHILKVARAKVRKRDKDLLDLRFAKRTNNGYAFFEAPHEIWAILHDIAKEVHKLYLDYEFSLIVELCSEVVNTDEEELNSLDLA